jgi:hypothetical protein
MQHRLIALLGTSALAVSAAQAASEENPKPVEVVNTVGVDVLSLPSEDPVGVDDDDSPQFRVFHATCNTGGLITTSCTVEPEQELTLVSVLIEIRYFGTSTGPWCRGLALVLGQPALSVPVHLAFTTNVSASNFALAVPLAIDADDRFRLFVDGTVCVATAYFSTVANSP